MFHFTGTGLPFQDADYVMSFTRRCSLSILFVLLLRPTLKLLQVFSLWEDIGSLGYQSYTVKKQDSRTG